MKSPWFRLAKPGARELMGIGNPPVCGIGACQRLATALLPGGEKSHKQPR